MKLQRGGSGCLGNQISCPTWLWFRTMGFLSLWGRGEGKLPTSAVPPRHYREGWTSGCYSGKCTATCLIVPVNTYENFEKLEWKMRGWVVCLGFFFGFVVFLKKLLDFTKLLFQQEISLHSLLILLPFAVLFLCFLSRNIWFLPCMYLTLVYIIVFQYF